MISISHDHDHDHFNDHHHDHQDDPDPDHHLGGAWCRRGIWAAGGALPAENIMIIVGSQWFLRFCRLSLFPPISYDYVIISYVFYDYHYYFNLSVQRCTLQLLHGILCEVRPRWTPGIFVIVIINSSNGVKDINVNWHFENDDQVLQR